MPLPYNIQFNDFENQELRECSIYVYKCISLTKILDVRGSAGRGGGSQNGKAVQLGEIYQRDGAHPRVGASGQSHHQSLSWACLFF